jgi:hypothetical protein
MIIMMLTMNSECPTERYLTGLSYGEAPYLMSHKKCLSIMQTNFTHMLRFIYKILCMLHAFFWVNPRRLKFLYADVSEHSVCSIFIGGFFTFHTYPPIKMEQTECSETSAYKIQTPGNYLEESIQHSEQGESLKSRRSL